VFQAQSAINESKQEGKRENQPMAKLNQFIRSEQGIQHAEEALLLALIGVALAAAVTTFKGSIAGVLGRATTAMA
jgi:Flp pilus assembly pilin Flp